MIRDPRSWGLLAMALACGSRAVAYLIPSGEILPLGLASIAAVVDPRWFGLLWGVNAIALFIVAICRTPAAARNSWVVVAPTLWGCLYFAGGIGGAPKGVSSALLFWAMALTIGSLMLVWPRPRRVRP